MSTTGQPTRPAPAYSTRQSIAPTHSTYIHTCISFWDPMEFNADCYITHLGTTETVELIPRGEGCFSGLLRCLGLPKPYRTRILSDERGAEYLIYKGKRCQVYQNEPGKRLKRHIRVRPHRSKLYHYYDIQPLSNDMAVPFVVSRNAGKATTRQTSTTVRRSSTRQARGPSTDRDPSHVASVPGTTPASGGSGRRRSTSTGSSSSGEGGGLSGVAPRPRDPPPDPSQGQPQVLSRRQGQENVSQRDQPPVVLRSGTSHPSAPAAQGGGVVPTGRGNRRTHVSPAASQVKGVRPVSTTTSTRQPVSNPAFKPKPENPPQLLKKVTETWETTSRDTPGVSRGERPDDPGPSNRYVSQRKTTEIVMEPVRPLDRPSQTAACSVISQSSSKLRAPSLSSTTTTVIIRKSQSRQADVQSHQGDRSSIPSSDVVTTQSRRAVSPQRRPKADLGSDPTDSELQAPSTSSSERPSIRSPTPPHLPSDEYTGGDWRQRQVRDEEDSSRSRSRSPPNIRDKDRPTTGRRGGSSQRRVRDERDSSQSQKSSSSSYEDLLAPAPRNTSASQSLSSGNEGGNRTDTVSPHFVSRPGSVSSSLSQEIHQSGLSKPPPAYLGSGTGSASVSPLRSNVGSQGFPVGEGSALFKTLDELEAGRRHRSPHPPLVNPGLTASSQESPVGGSSAHSASRGGPEASLRHLSTQRSPSIQAQSPKGSIKAMASLGSRVRRTSARSASSPKPDVALRRPDSQSALSIPAQRTEEAFSFMPLGSTLSEDSVLRRVPFRLKDALPHLSPQSTPLSRVRSPDESNSSMPSLGSYAPNSFTEPQRTENYVPAQVSDPTSNLLAVPSGSQPTSGDRTSLYDLPPTPQGVHLLQAQARRDVDQAAELLEEPPHSKIHSRPASANSAATSAANSATSMHTTASKKRRVEK